MVYHLISAVASRLSRFHADTPSHYPSLKYSLPNLNQTVLPLTLLLTMFNHRHRHLVVVCCLLVHSLRLRKQLQLFSPPISAPALARPPYVGHSQLREGRMSSIKWGMEIGMVENGRWRDMAVDR